VTTLCVILKFLTDYLISVFVTTFPLVDKKRISGGNSARQSCQAINTCLWWAKPIRSMNEHRYSSFIIFNKWTVPSYTVFFLITMELWQLHKQGEKDKRETSLLSAMALVILCSTLPSRHGYVGSWLRFKTRGMIHRLLQLSIPCISD